MNCALIFIISKHSVLVFYHGEYHFVVFGMISEFLVKEIQCPFTYNHHFRTPLPNNPKRTNGVEGNQGGTMQIGHQHTHYDLTDSPEPYDGSAYNTVKKPKLTRKRHPKVRIPKFDNNQTKKFHIMNLSNIPLTDDETAILEKGILFIPTPTSNMRPLQDTTNEYKRTLRLDFLFQGKENELDPFKKRSNYTPLTSGNTTLETYLTRNRNSHNIQIHNT